MDWIDCTVLIALFLLGWIHILKICLHVWVAS